MLIFLGLNARPTHFAWMSLLILVVTCTYSIYSFNGLDRPQEQFYQRAEFKEALHLREELAVTFCNLHHLEHKQCVLLKQFASAKVLFEVGVLKKIYQQTNTPKLGLREIASQDPALDFFDLLEFGPSEKTSADLKDQQYLKIYTQLTDLTLTLNADYRSLLKSNHLLSQVTLTPFNLMRANFLHAGWMHLIGNMMFFFVFAIFIESRLGPFFTLLIYLLGGSIGMFLQSKYFLPATVHLLGASGCVSAILGAALALFWRRKIKVLLSFVVYNKIILIPAIVALPLLSVGQDIIGALDPMSHVGHIAHLGGFFSGFIMAHIFAEMTPVPKEFIFLEEARLFSVFKKSQDPNKKLLALKKILKINPCNEFVLGEATAWANPALENSQDLNKSKIDFFSSIFAEEIKLKLQNEPAEKLIDFIGSLSPHLDYRVVFKYLPVNLQIRIQDSWLLRRLYTLCIENLLRVETKLSLHLATEQWNEILQIISNANLEQAEQEQITLLYQKCIRKNPEHFYLKKLGQLLLQLKASAYVQSS